SDMSGIGGLGRERDWPPLRAEPAEPFRWMLSVRRPAPAVGRSDGDDGIEEAAGLVDHIGQLLVMGVGQVALERCRLDRIDGQHGKQSRMPAQRLFILAHQSASGLLDQLLDLPYSPL